MRIKDYCDCINMSCILLIIMIGLTVVYMRAGMVFHGKMSAAAAALLAVLISVFTACIRIASKR